MQSNNDDGASIARSNRLGSPPAKAKGVVTVLSLAGMLAVGLGMTFVICGFIPTDSLVLRTWLSSLLALGVIWGYVLLRYEGTIPLRSDVLVMLGFSLSNLLPPLYLSLRLSSGSNIDMWNVADMYPLVAVLTMIGALALLLGYHIAGSKFIVWQRVYSPPAKPRSLTVVYIMTLIVLVAVWTARMVLLAKGTYYHVYADSTFMFGRWYSLATQLSSYGLIVPVLMWLLVDRKPRWHLWAWLTTVAELAWVLPSGARTDLLVTLFGLLLVTWWKKRLPKWKIATLVVLAVMIMPVLGQYRYTISRFAGMNQVGFGATARAIQASFGGFAGSSGGVAPLSWADSLGGRLYDGQFLGYLLKHYRATYDWEYGGTYFARLLSVFFPHFLLPQQPITQVPLNHWFRLVAGGSAPTTFLGEGYINFGYLGVPLMAFLMGIILGMYDRLFFKYRNNAFIVAVYLFTVSQFPFMVTQSFASWLALLRNAMLLALVCAIAIGFLKAPTTMLSASHRT